jgi:hypothetical protein
MRAHDAQGCVGREAGNSAVGWAWGQERRCMPVAAEEEAGSMRLGLLGGGKDGGEVLVLVLGAVLQARQRTDA